MSSDVTGPADEILRSDGSSRVPTRHSGLSRTSLIEQHFHFDSAFWKDVYTDDTLYGAIYRERRTRVLSFVDGLHLPHDARALDIGCGAGTTSVALAERGLRVDAVDAVPRMVNLTQQATLAGGMEDRIKVRLGDVHRLAFAAGTFDLVVAVGVMEWMASLAAPLNELYRVLRPGGWLIANVDNSRALHCLLDPRMSPILGPAKRSWRRLAERLGLIAPVARPTRCSRARFDRALRAASFGKVGECTSGFGPITLAGLHLLSDQRGVALHHLLQSLADGPVPLLRHGGDTYLVLAQKHARQS